MNDLTNRLIKVNRNFSFFNKKDIVDELIKDIKNEKINNDKKENLKRILERHFPNKKFNDFNELKNSINSLSEKEKRKLISEVREKILSKKISKYLIYVSIPVAVHIIILLIKLFLWDKLITNVNIKID